MRISRLDLLSYGKFTDKTIALPRAAKDFHLLVGPNEAGHAGESAEALTGDQRGKQRSGRRFGNPHQRDDGGI